MPDRIYRIYLKHLSLQATERVMMIINHGESVQFFVGKVSSSVLVRPDKAKQLNTRVETSFVLPKLRLKN